MLCEPRRRPRDEESDYESDYDSDHGPFEEEFDGCIPKRLAKLYPYLHDLINLSSTCKGLRDLLAPRIFNKLYLQNTTKSALSVQAIADGNYAHCVKTIQYVGICKQDQRAAPLEEVYPPELDQVLSNLSILFPHLHHLTVEFPYHDNERWIDDFSNCFEGYEDLALAGEKNSTWLAFMAVSFKAIIATPPTETPNQIQSLEIRHLNPANTSTFYADEFHAFLSRLKSFTLSIKPLENGAGWAFNTTQIFNGFADCLGFWFLENLDNIEELTFDPSYSAPLGKGEPSQAYWHDIGLWHAEMRRLQTLTLCNIVICPELQDFLIWHLDTLRSITLQECYAIQPDRDDPGVYAWRHFFPPLAEALVKEREEDPASGPNKFEVIYNKPQIKMLDLEDPSPYVDADLIARTKEKLAAEPDARVFLYGYVDQKYGGLYPECITPLEEFLLGDDEREYRKFMAVLVGVQGGRGKTE
ncbi:hypothetical protein BJX63DRAFT_419620 [Aspergillus granulosus]|uniref:F-box domain-containing protein n=1 Tax=Aspergillus granulosus TaxID=176169 RepID=A0ABR4HPE9_9EURO